MMKYFLPLLLLGTLLLCTAMASQIEMSFSEEEISFQNGGVTLSGTLTIPDTTGPYPVVVLLHGSGPIDRDCNLWGWKFFKEIAEYLTRRGIAVLRYDKRGVGKSTGDTFQSTTDDYAKDALAAVEYLQTRKDINPKWIGVCGHSEGGAVAPLAASRSQAISFVIGISGPAIRCGDNMLTQIGLGAMAEGATKSMADGQVKDLETAVLRVARGESKETLRTLLEKMVKFEISIMNEDKRREIKDMNEYRKKKITMKYESMSSPWFQYLFNFEAGQALEKIRQPVLLMYGGHDLQVPAKINRKASMRALEKGGNPDVTIKVFPSANHIYQSANTGSETEYPVLPKKFVPGFLEFIGDWISSRVDIAG